MRSVPLAFSGDTSAAIDNDLAVLVRLSQGAMMTYPFLAGTWHETFSQLQERPFDREKQNRRPEVNTHFDEHDRES